MKHPRTTRLFSLLAGLALAGTAQAQTYQTNSFTAAGGINTPPLGFSLNLSDPTNQVNFTTAGAVFLYPNDKNRNYVRTDDAAYNTVDFQAEINVPNNQAFATFFGIGTGLNAGPNFYEPSLPGVNNVYIRARQSGGTGTIVQGITGNNVFPSFTGGVGSGPLKYTIVYSAAYNVATFRIASATQTNTIGPVTLAALSSYSIFFGGNNGSTLSNLVIKAPDAPIVPTGAHFTTPPPTVYLGVPPQKQWVAADYNVGSGDMTADINTVYSTTDAGICDVVAFGGQLTPVSAGICQIIATNSVLGVAATQTVTVVSSAPAHYFTHTLQDPAMPTNCVLNLGTFNNTVQFTTGGAVFGPAGAIDANRAYVATAYNQYNATDFSAEIICVTNADFASFFGIGRGGLDAVGNEPRNSVYVRARRTGGGTSSVQILGHGATGFTTQNFNLFNNGIGTGPIYMKMSYTVSSGQIAFTLTNATISQTITIPMPGLTHPDGYRIFYGGNNNDTFTNFVVKNPIVLTGTPTNLYFVNVPAQLYAGQPTTYPLTVYSDYDDGSKSNNVTSAITAYGSVDPSVFTVNGGGLITAGISGTNNVTADWSGAWGTLSATQEVRVLAPISVSIELPPVFEGCRSADATVRANFSATITNVDVTGFTGVSGTWAAPQGLGFISVAGNVVTPLLQGTEDLTVTYDTLSATQAVTVLSAPAYYRTDSFIGALGTPLPAGYYSAKQSAGNPGGVVSPAGALFVNAAAAQRDYIRSAIHYYDQSNWVASVYLKTNAAFSGFFGVGQGVGGGASGEPLNSIYMRVRNSGGFPTVIGGAGGTFNQWPGGVGNGPMILRLKYEVGTGLYFTIITGNTNETVGPVALPVLAQGYSIFFGGAEIDRAQTYANLNITATTPGAPPAPALTQSVSGSTLTLNWSDGFLLRAPAVTGPWTQVINANSPYTFTVNPANAQEYFRAVSPYVP